MEVKAKVQNIRMSPRKVRLVADVARGLGVGVALEQLQFTNKIARKPIIKLINSAIANAVNNFELDKNNLFVKEIKVDEGVTLKRWLPRAHGRATPLNKRSSHISVVLGEIKDSGKKVGKKQAIEPAVKLDAKLNETKKEEVKTNSKTAKKEKSEAKKGSDKEEGKNIVDPRMEGRHAHTKIEGHDKGFTDKIFRRKSG